MFQAMQLGVQLIQLAVVSAAAIVTYRAFFQTRNSGQSAARTYIRTGLKDVVLRELTERSFRERPGAKIPGKDGSVELLREAKTIARHHVKANYAEWSSASTVDKRDNWQNHVAFETAEGLQQFGLAAFTGAIPLHAALANVADVVIDDWLICAPWIKSYQMREGISKPVTNDDNGVVYYHRRHAEWIFLIAVAWMRKEGWHYADIYAGTKAIPHLDQIASRLRVLTKADGDLVPKDIRQTVLKLTGIAID